MRFLCLSDIHGNKEALDAILKEGDLLGFDQIVVCGDICYPGTGALAVWQTLVKRRALCVQGLGDRALASVDPDAIPAQSAEAKEKLERLRAIRAELGELILAHMKKLPSMARLPLESGHTMLVVHGSPGDPTETLTRDMTEEELVARLGDEPGDLVICGSSHEQFDGIVADVRIASVGSVGEAPGGTHAYGAIVESNQGGFDVTMLSVPLFEPDDASVL